MKNKTSLGEQGTTSPLGGLDGIESDASNTCYYVTDNPAADDVLQSKNVAVEAIDEHIKLNKELEKHGLSTCDIHKLVTVLINAKRYGFEGKEIADKLYDFKFLEWKEKEFKDKRKKLSKRISKYKDIVPLTEDISALGIGINELLALEIGIKEAAKYYNLPYISATMCYYF